MTESLTLHPYCALLSYALRTATEGSPSVPEANRAAEQPERETAEFEPYIGGSEISPVGFSRIERMAIALPEKWQPHVAGVFMLRPRRRYSSRYNSRQYLIKFADERPEQLVSLLLEGDVLDHLASQIGRRDPLVRGTNVRSLGQTNPDAGVLVVFDAASELAAGSVTSDVILAFRTALRQDSHTFSALPSGLVDALFAKGPAVGSCLDSAAVLRLKAPPRNHVIRVPQCAIDWVDFSDDTYVIADLADTLEREPLVAQNHAGYLEPFSEADTPDLWRRLTMDRSTALTAYLTGREIFNGITAETQGSTFGPQFGQHFRGEGFSGFQFHSWMMAYRHREVMRYEAGERKLLEREKLIASILRDRASWHVADAHTKLAEANNRLIGSGNELTKAGNELTDWTGRALESIRETTRSTDRLTRWVVLLTWIVGVLTVIGTVGVWIPDRTKERLLNSLCIPGLSTCEEPLPPSSGDHGPG